MTSSRALSKMSKTATQVCGLRMSPCPVPRSGLKVLGDSPPYSLSKPARPSVSHARTVQSVRTATLASMPSSTSHSISSDRTPSLVNARRITALLTESKAFLMPQEEPNSFDRRCHAVSSAFLSWRLTVYVPRPRLKACWTPTAPPAPH